MKQVPFDPETQFSELLAQLDEALATAPHASSVSSHPFVSELSDADQRRFARVHGCLQLLEQDRRRQTTSSPEDQTDQNSVTVPHQIGRFRIIRRLGSGAFGVVFLAEDPLLRRQVAIKMPLATVFQSKELHDRFLRECRAAAMLNHPGIVRVLESGDIQGIPYQVAEYVKGERLSDLIKRQRPAVQASAKIVRSLADAVQHAHDHGVLHRDIKPDNILLQSLVGTASDIIAVNSRKDTDSKREVPEVQGNTQATNPTDPVPRITDFGLARVEDDNAALSHSGMVVGTPKYMSPEQLHGRTLMHGPQSDIYSLGVVLHELLTGVVPFADANGLQARIAISGNPVPSFRSVGTGISKDLETICLKCLRVRPEDRYASAGELRDDLGRYLDGWPTLARPIPLHEQFVRWVTGNRKLAALLGLLALSVFVVFVQAIRNDRASRQQNITLSSTLSQLTAEKLRADEALKLANASRIEAVQSETQYKETAWLARQGEYSSAILQASSLWHNDEIDSMNQMLLPLFPDGTGDLGGFEWRYLWNQGKTLRPMKGHSDFVTDLAVAADGERVWTIGQDNSIRRWRLNTGALESIWSLGRNAFHVNAAISRNTRRAVTSRTLDQEQIDEVNVWDLETGRVLMSREFPADLIRTVAISADGNSVLYGGTERSGESGFRPFVEVWFPDSDRVIHDDSSFRTLHVGQTTVPGHAISAISFAPDGNGLVIAVMGEFTPAHFQLFQTSLNVVAAAASEKPASIFGPLTQIQWHPGMVRRMTFSPDGNYVATTMLGIDSSWAAVWDLKRRSLAGATEKFSRGISSIGFDSTGTKLGLGLILPGLKADGTPAGPGEIAVTAARSELRLWDFVADTHQTLPYQAKRELEFLKPLNSEAGNGWFVGHGGGALNLWQPGAVAPYRELNGHRPNEVWDLACSSDGSVVFSVGDDHILRAWDPASGVETKSSSPHASLVSCVAVSPDGRWVAAGDYDDQVVVYDAESLHPHATLTGHTHDLRTLAFSPNGQMLATAGRDRIIRLWNVPKFDLAGKLEGHSDSVRALIWTADGQLISAGSDRRVLIWDANGRVVRERTESEGIHTLAFAPAGLRIPVPASSAAAMVETSRSQTTTVSENANAQGIITVQGDELLAIGMNHGTVRLWHLPTDTVFFEAQNQGVEIRSLAFSPDGRTLAVGGVDEAVHLWHVVTGRNVLTFDQLGSSVHRVTFSPDGTHLLAALHDGTIRVWHAPPVP